MQALAIAAGCIATECTSVPFEASEESWRTSHVREADSQTADGSSKYSAKDADVRANVINGLLNDDDIIVITVGWKADQLVRARAATTSKELAGSWVHNASTPALMPRPSLVAIVPVLVIAACVLVVLHRFYELLPPLDSIVSFYAESPSNLAVGLAIIAIAASFRRFLQEIRDPRTIRRTRHCWHLPLGRRVRRRGGDVSVAQLTGWARAL